METSDLYNLIDDFTSTTDVEQDVVQYQQPAQPLQEQHRQPEQQLQQPLQAQHLQPEQQFQPQNHYVEQQLQCQQYTQQLQQQSPCINQHYDFNNENYFTNSNIPPVNNIQRMNLKSHFSYRMDPGIFGFKIVIYKIYSHF